MAGFSTGSMAGVGRLSVKVGDLVIMPGAVSPATGIVLRLEEGELNSRHPRIQVYWIEDAEASWEPKKWLEVVSEG